MRYTFLFFIISLLSCNNERVLQLPEIDNAIVTEVLDVSPAYIFYDETQPDSTLLNRKNLISTTNWLVNVDRRLALRQAIPHIKFLQDKKRNAEIHKNENAKNYFTCNDTSISNLGFIEFTDVNFSVNQNDILNTENICQMTINSMSRVTFSTSMDLNIEFSEENFNAALKVIQQEYGPEVELVLVFNESLSFQDYITVKNTLKSFEDTISNNEFFFNL